MHSRHQFRGGGKHIGHLVQAGEARSALQVAVDQHVSRHQVAVIVRLHPVVAQDGIGVLLPDVGMKLDHEPGGVVRQVRADLVLEAQRPGRDNVQVVEAGALLGRHDEAGIRDRSHHRGAARLERSQVRRPWDRRKLEQEVGAAIRVSRDVLRRRCGSGL
jgi:hypothetical protein